jgi:Gas vesicle synthesis protein GvpL/GvpF
MPAMPAGMAGMAGMAVTEPRGVWVYAVAERAVAERAVADPAGLVAGVGANPVRVVAAAGLAAVAEDVPLAEFGESALRRNLEDLSWLEAAARAHHRVIDAVAEQGPVVPMRLATVYRADASVTAALSERAADFREAIRRTAAREEWGVKAYAVQDARAPAGADAGAPASAEGGAGAAYLRRRQNQLATQRNTRRAAAASAETIHAGLCGLAAGSRLYPPQPPQLTGSRAQMMLNAAYLVDEERSRDFAAAVTSLARQHPGVRLELTGPWPPYSFAGAAEDEVGRQAGREGLP